MLLDKISVNEIIVAFMSISGVILMIRQYIEKFSQDGKRLESLERRVSDMERELENNNKQNKLIMKALLAILSKDPKQEERVKEELNEFLLDK